MLGCLVVVSCTLLSARCSGKEELDVPIIGHEGDYAPVLKKAEELSSGPLAKFAKDEELSEEEKQSLIKATAQFEALARFQPTQFAPRLANGMIYRAIGDLDLAENNLRECLRNIPVNDNPLVKETSAEAHYQLSRVLYDKTKFEDALAEASTALEGVPTNPNYLVARASAFAKLDKLADAKKDLETALKLDPEHKRGTGLAKLLK